MGYYGTAVPAPTGHGLPGFEDASFSTAAPAGDVVWCDEAGCPAAECVACKEGSCPAS